MDRRRRLDERHLCERLEDPAPAEARLRRRRPDRRDRPEVRGVTVVGRTAAVSDTGRKRRHNEDSFVLQPPIFAVVDGMGGANAGEVASRIAADALREGSQNGGSGEGAVTSLVEEANRRVYRGATEDAPASGRGRR